MRDVPLLGTVCVRRRGENLRAPASCLCDLIANSSRNRRHLSCTKLSILQARCCSEAVWYHLKLITATLAFLLTHQEARRTCGVAAS
eukprot:8012-Heterococcus_DN1.PRE.3